MKSLILFPFHNKALLLKKFPGLKLIFYGPDPHKEAAFLCQKNIYVLPTKFGLIFCLLLVVMLLISINYEKNLGFLLTFLAGSVMAVSILHTHRNLAGLRITPGWADPVFAGQTAWFQVFVQDTSGRKRHSLQFREKSGKAVYSLQPWENKTAAIPAPAKQRGWKRLDTVLLSCTHPFGLFVVWSKIRPDLFCLVYPKPIELGDDFSLDPNLNSSSNGSRTRFSHEPEDFSEHAQHNLAESYKRIDWKAFARQRGLLSKKFEHKSQGLLELDLTKTPGEDLEQKLSYLCALILEAEKRLVPYSLRLPGQEFASGMGDKHKHRCLKALATYDYANTHNL